MSADIRRRTLTLGAIGATAAPALLRAASASVRQVPTAVQRSAHVGINLAGIAYWTTEFPFADLMKNSGGFSARGGSGKLALRPDGYPAALEKGQAAACAVAWNGTRYPTGAYTVRWDGSGELSFPELRGVLHRPAPHHAVVEVRESGPALWVRIERTEPSDPIRNIRFLWPGTEAAFPAEPFNPAFLAKVAPFRTLRFMDWGATNGSKVERWSERASTASLTWAQGGGVPIETMIALANRLGADPWFCIPHRADDDYVRAFATLVKARLDTGLVATIEYSNEVWNGGFEQARWAVGEARRLALPTPSNLGSIFYAERVLRIVAIFGEVFGAAGRARWSPVVAGQTVWTQFSADALAWKDTAAQVDALAIAPYFQAAGAAKVANAEATLALAPDDLVDQMLADIRGEIRTHIGANAALARRHRLRLVGYEGGAGDTAAAFPAALQDRITTLLAAAHRRPHMRDVYREYYETWIGAGGGVLNQYNDIGRWSKWGLWGALEYVGEDASAAPKYQGLLDVIAAHPLR